MHPQIHSFPQVCHHISYILVILTDSFISKLMCLPLVIPLLWAPGSWLFRGDSSQLISCFFLQNSNTSGSSIACLSFSPEKNKLVVKIVSLIHKVFFVLLRVIQLVVSCGKKKVLLCKGLCDTPLVSIRIRAEPQIEHASHWFIKVLWDPKGCPLLASWFSQG